MSVSKSTCNMHEKRTKTNVLMPISLYLVLYILTFSVYLIELHTSQKKDDIHKQVIDIMKT